MARRTTHEEDHNIALLCTEEVRLFSTDWTFLLNFVQGNFEPDEIFDNGELDQWASNNEYYTKSDIFSKFNPDEIYDDKTLSEWAEENGYVKKDE